MFLSHKTDKDALKWLASFSGIQWNLFDEMRPKKKENLMVSTVIFYEYGPALAENLVKGS